MSIPSRGVQLETRFGLCVPCSVGNRHCRANDFIGDGALVTWVAPYPSGSPARRSERVFPASRVISLPPSSLSSEPNTDAAPFSFPASSGDRYVPNPSPSVFRTTKNNHNILQGVAPPELRLTRDAEDNFDAWILKNGLRWTAEGGPLAPGGVDIAFIGAWRQLLMPL